MKTHKKLHKFTIDRSQRINGSTERLLSPDGSRLLNEQTGGKCCIGFYAKSCGVPLRELAKESCLQDLVEKQVAKTGIPDDALNNFYLRNDATGRADIRERRLTKMFREHNIAVKFVGKPPKKGDV